MKFQKSERKEDLFFNLSFFTFLVAGLLLTAGATGGIYSMFCFLIILLIFYAVLALVSRPKREDVYLSCVLWILIILVGFWYLEGRGEKWLHLLYYRMQILRSFADYRAVFPFSVIASAIVFTAVFLFKEWEVGRFKFTFKKYPLPLRPILAAMFSLSVINMFLFFVYFPKLLYGKKNTEVLAGQLPLKYYLRSLNRENFFSFEEEQEVYSLLNGAKQFANIKMEAKETNLLKYKKIKVVILDEFQKLSSCLRIFSVHSGYPIGVPYGFKSHGELIEDYIRAVLKTERFKRLLKESGKQVEVVGKSIKLNLSLPFSLDSVIEEARRNPDTLYLVNCSFGDKAGISTRLSSYSVNFLKVLAKAEQTENIYLFKAAGNSAAKSLKDYDIFTLAGFPLFHVYVVGGAFVYQRGEFAAPEEIILPYADGSAALLSGTSLSTPNFLLMFLEKLLEKQERRVNSPL